MELLPKPLRNDEGFSLIQVMIAAALMGALALYMARMQENNMKNTKAAQVLSEINAFHNKVNSILSNNDSCNANFRGAQISDGDEVSGLSLIDGGAQAVAVGTPVNNLVVIDSMEIDSVPDSFDSATGRHQLRLSIKYDKETGSGTKRTTVGYRYVEKTYDFFVIKCDYDTKEATTADFMGISLSDAYSICLSNCQSWTGQSDCNCRKDKFFHLVPDGWGMVLTYDCARSQKIYECDN
ncbi:MAG: hypothetical protein HOE90_22390 [Bacteriovoracaceae bacterium]|jgi:hypothetical protein|nr:hypothetical protein [Bacteriovoracaceae bacterium]